MGFDGGIARREVLVYCSGQVPRTVAGIARHLKTLPGFYPKTPGEKLGKPVRSLVAPLLSAGLLIKYTPQNSCWERAREMTTKGNRAAGNPVPRKVGELYQTNFLYSYDSHPPIISLPVPGGEMNFEANALLYHFPKPANYTWEMLNLLMAASDAKQKDDLRLHLYVLPFDYREIEFLEHVLDFGYEFREIKFPFRPSVDEAKGFLSELAVGKGSE
ncbi:MAG: hypothetical protein KAW41_01890 [Candidatus Diapherotrites archaeon]|nr:hypothetical protein [Candidatus Diapherotrites archaeon]